jgi:hypothetical protein
VLLIAAIFCSTGCLVIEKKTMVIVLPEDSERVHLYYTFEGLSVRDEGDTPLKQAITELNTLKASTLSFFVHGASFSGDDPNLKSFYFEPLRFYIDPNRKRQLCADRKVTVKERTQFLKDINAAAVPEIQRNLDREIQQIRDDLKWTRDQLKQPNTVKIAQGMGVGALLKAAEGLVELALEFDDESYAQAKKSLQKDFQIFRVEAGTIRLVFPTTPATAKRIAEDKKTKAWIKEMKSLVTPLSVVAEKDGLHLVVGKKGEPIRLTYSDPRSIEPKFDADLLKAAGNPSTLKAAGKPANAEKLIELFLMEVLKK